MTEGSDVFQIVREVSVSPGGWRTQRLVITAPSAGDAVVMLQMVEGQEVADLVTEALDDIGTKGEPE